MPYFYVSHFLTGQKSAIKNNLIVKSSDCKELKNAILTDFGIIKKRPGCTKVGTTLASSNILGLHDFGKNDGTHKQLTVNATKVYWNSSGTWTDSGITGLTTGKQTRFANFINLVFVVNGTDAMKDWDGATAYNARVASAPVANYICVFGDRLYTNNTTYKSRVQYSSIPDSTPAIVWTGGDSGSYDVQTDDGDFITGIHPRRDRLLVFKNHYIEGRDSNFKRISVVRDLGTPSNDTIVTINNKTYFFNFDDKNSTGVYEYGSSDPVKISSPIQDLIDDITIGTPSTQFFACKQYDNYILHIGTTQGMSNVVICYNTTHKAWSYWTMPSTVKTFGLYNDTNIIETYFGCDTGRVYKLSGNTLTDAYYSGSTDTTKNILLKIKTFPLHCSNPHVYKEFSNVVVFTNNKVPCTIGVETDDDGWKAIADTSKTTSVLSCNCKGYDITVDITDDSAGNPEIKGLAIDYSVENDTR